jgi:hypothetical protein
MNRSKAIAIGCLSSLLLFIAINIYTYDDGLGEFTSKDGVRATECFDCLRRFGWPLRHHQSGTLLHIDEFLWPGFIADILILLITTTGTGLLCKALLKKPNRRV